MRECSVPDCTKPPKGRGFCAAHYHRVRRYGDPLGAPPPKMYCKNGHERTPETLRWGRSDCSTCHREQTLARARARGVQPLHRPTCPAGHENVPENRRAKGDCKVCHRDAENRRRKADLEGSRKKSRDYARANPEGNKRRRAEWAAANPERMRELGRETMRRRSLGRNTEAVAYADVLRGDPCSYCGRARYHGRPHPAGNRGGPAGPDRA